MEARDGPRKLAPGTILARAGREVRNPERTGTGREPVPLAEPLTLSSVWRFDDLDQVNEVWEGRQGGFIYRRFGHPNLGSLERIVAALEGTEEALACASGMGALLVALTAQLGQGDTVLAQEGLYGGTQTLLAGQLSRFGIGAVLVAEPTRAAFAAALEAAARGGGRPRAILVETIANPSLEVAELPGLADLSREKGLLFVVDNTFATPLGCRPSRFGRGLVVHSTTKYLNGHSDVIGGVVAGPRDLVGPARAMAIAAGVTMGPLDAWLTVRGLRTLHLRFSRQQENAARIASWLAARPEVSRVLYPGLASHPSHATARQVLDGFGGMVSFELEGGEAAVARFIERLRLVAFCPSLGETETTITYPALTSHRTLTAAEKTAAGAGPGLIRLSAGTEDVEDILADLGQALEASAPT